MNVYYIQVYSVWPDGLIIYLGFGRLQQYLFS